MKIVECKKYGSAENLQIIDIEKPVPKDNEVLIKIHAATVTIGDCKMRTLKFGMGVIQDKLYLLPFRMMFGFRKPKRKTLGMEMSGEIEAVGKDVKLYKAGDQVYGATSIKYSTYTEYTCMPENERLSIKPKNMTYGEAAAVPVGGSTALNFLKSGNIRSCKKVLIYGASGSVGTFAVQLAKYYGAEVTAVCSGKNFDLVKSIGADKVIDYTKENFRENGEKYDMIFDTVMKLSKSGCNKALKQGGVFLTTKKPFEANKDDLVVLKKVIEEGKLISVIDRKYSLDQIQEAHKYVEKGHKKGNVVINIIKE